MKKLVDKETLDQLKFAKEGANNLAKRNGYMWTSWLQGRQGRTTAAFDREGQRWSLDFFWTPSQPLEELAKNIEQMDFLIVTAMKEFGALKLGAMVRQASDVVAH